VENNVDWILGLGSMTHLYMMSSKWKYAGYFGVILQMFWFVFSISTNNYGLIVSSIGFTIIHIRTIYGWHLKDIIKGDLK
jgi:hypothetical protein